MESTFQRTIKLYEEVGDSTGFVELYQHVGSDQTIIDAARVSYSSLHQPGESIPRWRPEADPKLLRYLLRNEHHSPFEHCSITWCIKVPLFVARQWHRHRVWAYNEESRRYRTGTLEFYLPDQYRPQSSSSKQASDWGQWINPELPEGTVADMMRGHVQTSVERYHRMLDAGVAREMARMVLPQNMYTSFYGSVNLRNALAFIALREHEHAQWEIVQASKAMRLHLEHLFPEAMAAWYLVRAGVPSVP